MVNWYDGLFDILGENSFIRTVLVLGIIINEARSSNGLGHQTFDL